MATNLKRPVTPLVPVSKFPVTTKNTALPILDATYVGDWSTLHLTAFNDLASALVPNDRTSSVVIRVRFLELSSTGSLFIVAGRTLCMGAVNLDGTNIDPTNLDVRLPIRSNYVDISYAISNTQTNVTKLNFGAWVSADPTDVYPILEDVGSFLNTLNTFGPDSILGESNATLGILTTGAGNALFVEFGQQTIGKCTVRCQTIDPATGAGISAGEITVGIITKAWDDTSAANTEQSIWNLGNVTDLQAQGVPLVGFREGVLVINNSGPSRNLRTKISVFPEYL